MTSRALKITIDLAGNAQKGLDGILGGLGGIGKLAGGAALGGVVAIGAGLAGASAAGLGMNNAMEQATARINAFTKDGAKTAELLEIVRERAAKTPFAFNEMAAATASLLPAAKDAQGGIEGLLGQAEILAASNPAEGLEGAAFALKEAVSGDFTSIIERFNLPRSFINKLKEEGVPALEIVRQSMQELGLDADLVGALAETAQGRWSTFKDTLQGLAAKITQPIFDVVSGSLGGLNEKLAANAPALEAIAGQLAGGVKAGIDWLAELLPKIIDSFNTWSSTLGETTGPAMLLIEDALNRIAAAFGINSEEISGQDVILKIFESTLKAITTAIQIAAVVMQSIAWAVEKVSDAIRIAKALGSQWAEIMRLSVDSIKRGIDSVVRKWNDFRNAVSSAVDAIPDWLIPGSPTPFEIGLKGIASAAGQAGKAIAPAFTGLPNAMPVGASGGFIPAPTSTAGGVGIGGAVSLQFTYAPLVSTASKAEAEQVLRPILEQVIRDYNTRKGIR